MQPIKGNRSIFDRLPEGCSSSVAEFVALLDRRLAYLDGVLAVTDALRMAPKKRMAEVIAELEVEASELRLDTTGRLRRMAEEIVDL